MAAPRLGFFDYVKAAFRRKAMFRAPLAEMGQGWLVWASATGVALGVIGLLVVQMARRRSPHGADSPG